VLVVDDEPVVLRYLASALQTRGYANVLAEDGEAGLALFLKFRDEIGLVITDVAMPRMSGPDMVREIRKLGSAVPIMFITGYSPGFVIPPEFQACASLKKPFTTVAFFDVVDHCLKGGKLG
jgi:DNA-binding response OmpR family regulator